MKLVPANSGSFLKWKEEFKYNYNLFLGDSTSKKKPQILIDLLISYLVYGSWINNYFEYRFWEKDFIERGNFITWRRAVSFLNSVNGPRFNPIFRYKHIFLREFKEFVYRDWLYVADSSIDELYRFFDEHEFVIEKRDSGMCGEGVRKIAISDIDDFDSYFRYACDNKLVLEECITEVDDLSKYHNMSLNTIRVTTFLEKDRSNVRVIGTVFRMGNNGSNVDNASSGGIFASVDCNTGRIISNGVDFLGKCYISHPYSGEKIIDSYIPQWNKIKTTCAEAARKYPETRFVGWDIVVRQGVDSQFIVEIVEGNDRPNIQMLQIPLQKGLYNMIKGEIKA